LLSVCSLVKAALCEWLAIEFWVLPVESQLGLEEMNVFAKQWPIAYDIQHHPIHSIHTGFRPSAQLYCTHL